MHRYTEASVPVFAGPSLFGRALEPPFAPMPPARAGDLLRLLNGPACTVILIDGLFDQCPSVWHKEILLLLSRGFRVIGAASMGALRAAELQSFGMTGCGAIFAAYASGRLTGDDEVAVAHAPASHGWKPLSIPQVNVRATLCAAVRGGILPVGEARRLRAVSAGIPYADRSWPELLGGTGSTRLADWVVTNAVDLKRRDAEEALGLASRICAIEPPRLEAPPITPFMRRLADWAGVALDRV